MPTTNRCQEMELLIQADIDGELSAADAAATVVHREQCSQCAEVYRQLHELQRSLRQELSYYSPSPEFRATLAAKISQQEKPASTTPPMQSNKNRQLRWRVVPAFAAGAVLAASLALFLVAPAAPQLADVVVAEHIRALQPGHLLDVVSSDQHNVKPWFDGKLDFSPPVKDFSQFGFSLAGGRLDYLGGRSVAALIYQHGKHPINVFIWPSADGKNLTEESQFLVRNGYNVFHWTQENMVFWIVSDLNETQLSDFVKLWQGTVL